MVFDKFRRTNLLIFREQIKRNIGSILFQKHTNRLANKQKVGFLHKLPIYNKNRANCIKYPQIYVQQFFKQQKLNKDDILQYPYIIHLYISSMIGDEKQKIPNLNLPDLHRWLHCLVVVSFDINEGQKIETTIPNLPLSTSTQKQICMLSFPDSNSTEDGSGQHSFKYTYKLSNGLYGFACFKQIKDKTQQRGYLQKSIVILSELPFVYFYEKMVEFIMFKCMKDSNLEGQLWDICQQVVRWPDPIPKHSYILPIMTYELQINIPNYIHQVTNKTHFYTNKTGDPEPEIMQKQTNQEYNLYSILSQEQLQRSGLFQEIQLYDIFVVCPEAIWELWEHAMLNKSVLIIAGHPQKVSHAVLGAISLIYPFAFFGNIIPYMTIYHPELEALQNSTASHIFGATNPLFTKLFNPANARILELNSKYRPPKHLKPLKEIIRGHKSEQQRVINQLAIRKHFYKLSRALMNLIDYELCLQANDLKLFNEKEFMKRVKERKDFYGLDAAFSSKKYLFCFIEDFVKTPNFQNFLRERNAIKTQKK